MLSFGFSYQYYTDFHISCMKNIKNQSVYVSWMCFMKMGWKLVGDRLMECVTVSDQTNCQHLEMYKEGAGKVDRVVMCLCG